MKKRIFLILLTSILIAGIVFTWKIFGPATSEPEGNFFYIKTGESFSSMKKNLTEKEILHSSFWFQKAAVLFKFNIPRAGKYPITKGMSVYQLIRMLKNGIQSPVNLVITKSRLKEDLARKCGNLFEFDSSLAIQFFSSNDSLKSFGVDTNTMMAIVIPNTYTYFWNTTPRKVFQKLFAEWEKFWTDERKSKAAKLGLTPIQVSTLASIVDEESIYAPEKSNIASVYLNRLQKKMPLQADPTVKFALKDFALKRIYEKHLSAESPYNTYKISGLPPGPICTPQATTLDAVLNAPKTDYLYFVAKSDFSGVHVFTTNFKDHLKKAKEYQQALNRQDFIRKANK